MTDRRCVFIDFDGTFADHGIAPFEHGEAVRRARAGGHVVLLCTGRPGSIVAPDVVALFDGLVSSAGAHVRVGDQVLRDDRFPADLARRTVEMLQAEGATFALEAPEGLYGSDTIGQQIAERVEDRRDTLPEGIGRGGQDILDAVAPTEDLRTASFAKISIWASPRAVSDVAEDIGPEVGSLPNSISDDGIHSGELFLAGVDKADGVRQVADHLGFPLEATVGIGDGLNDLGMLRAAGTAVGIEDGAAEVVAAADILVPGPSGHGIVLAFERLGMI